MNEKIRKILAQKGLRYRRDYFYSKHWGIVAFDSKKAQKIGKAIGRTMIYEPFADGFYWMPI